MVYTHWGTFEVSGECLDLDISDTLLVAAANYNGFFVFSIDSENQTLDTVYHGTDLDPNVGILSGESANCYLDGSVRAT